MQEINEANNETNDLGIKKVGHLYENIKFQCNDDVNGCSADFRSAYLGIIKNAASGNYDALNQLIDNTFNADVEVLEKTLKDSENLSLEAKKKFFFNGEEGEIIDVFRNYIKIIYVERILFDILNIGLKDLDNNSINEMLQSKQNDRIDNFIASMTNDEVTIPRLDNGFETDYTGHVQDKNNFLRYLIYFRYLKENLPHIAEEIKKLKSYCCTKDEISKNDDLIKQKGNELQKLAEDINQLSKNIEARQKELDKLNFLQRNAYESEQKIDKENLKKKQEEKTQVEQELERLKHVKLILESYGNELESAQQILKDIQNIWGSAFENFIFPYMLKYPGTISQLRKDYSFSMWDFVKFLLDHNNDQNFNRALYEIDKTKDSKDFEDEEDKKRTGILQSARNSINSFDENRCQLVNDVIKNRCQLENSWMRKAFWSLFAGISSFVGIAMAPLLAIIIPDIFMALGALLMTLIGVGLIILLTAVACASNGNGLSGLERTGIERFIFWSLYAFKNMPWLTFNSIPILSYYCSTFFSVSIVITTAFFIGSIVFYVYKRMQFNSIIEVPNLQIQPEKSPLESQLEIYNKQFEKENSPAIGKNQHIHEGIILNNK